MNIGVKQRCSSGPRSFISFIHDLPMCVCPEDVTSTEFATYFMNKIVRCLLWADDLVLCARTLDGAQRQLDALNVYANDNKLTVNTDKTESMYVCTNRKTPYPSNVFTFRGARLRHVSKYKYVGAWIDRFGSTEVHVDEALIKATKAMHACMSRVCTLSAKCPMYMKTLMFKTYVQSLLLYACEVTPYTKRQISRMNSIIVKYARWATGLPGLIPTGKGRCRIM
jgi:hypothetical protein